MSQQPIKKLKVQSSEHGTKRFFYDKDSKKLETAPMIKIKQLTSKTNGGSFGRNASAKKFQRFISPKEKALKKLK